MKSVIVYPWKQHTIRTVYCGSTAYYTSNHYYRKTMEKNQYAVEVFGCSLYQNEDIIFYISIIYECVVDDFEEKRFTTPKAAMDYCDAILREANCKFIPEHIMILE